MRIKETRTIKILAPRHDFVERLVNEVPGKELEAKLGIKGSRPMDSPAMVQKITDGISSSGEVSLVDNPFIPTVNIVDKYTHDNRSFSVVHRVDGETFIKCKPGKDKRKDGVIVSAELKIPWNKEDPFPEELVTGGIFLEKSTLIKTIERHKDGIFVKKGERIYQIVFDTVKPIDDSTGKEKSQTEKKAFQQIEIEYKGRGDGSATDSQEKVIDEISEEIIYIRDLVKGHLFREGISTKVTKQTKTAWLLKNT